MKPDFREFNKKAVICSCPQSTVALAGRTAAHLFFHRTGSIVRACALLAARDVPVRLLVAGDGPLRRELEQLAEALGIEKTVHWLGSFSRPDKLLQGSDIFALASEGEAFGLVLAAAQACQVPVVGSRSGSIPEVIEGGATGILAIPGDPASFAGAVERLARDPALRSRMGTRGKERVLKRFTSELAVRRTTELYRELYEGHPDVVSSPTAHWENPRLRADIEVLGCHQCMSFYLPLAE